MENITPAGAIVLVSFRAGRMRLEGSLLKADDRKGQLRVLKVHLRAARLAGSNQN